MNLTKEQIGRYGRQLILPELGVKGQQRLLASSVLLIGAGGLGSPAAFYLAAAGVGTLIIADPDTVSLNNLHRQIAHTTDRIGRQKSESAREQLLALNPGIQIKTHAEAFTAENGRSWVSGVDLVVDGSDNFLTRYLVNDACVLEGKPLVHGAVVNFRGQLFTVAPKASACMRCVFPEPPEPGQVPSCAEAGVIGAGPGIIGSLMALEAIKVLAGIGQPLYDKLLVFDGLATAFRTVSLERDSACAVCGDTASILDLRAIPWESASCEV